MHELSHSTKILLSSNCRCWPAGVLINSNRLLITRIFLFVCVNLKTTIWKITHWTKRFDLQKWQLGLWILVSQAEIMTLSWLWRSVKCWSNVGDRLLITNVGTMLRSNWMYKDVDVQGLPSVYSAPVVDCKIPAFVQRWVYSRPNLLQSSIDSEITFLSECINLN